MTFTHIPRQPKDSVLVRTDSGSNISLPLTKNVVAESPFDKSEYASGQNPYTHVTGNNRNVQYSLPSGRVLAEIGVRREGEDDIEKYKIYHTLHAPDSQPAAIASLDDEVCRNEKLRLEITESAQSRQDGGYTKTISIAGDPHIKRNYDNSGNKQDTEVLKSNGTWEQYVTARAESVYYGHIDKKPRAI